MNLAQNLVASERTALKLDDVEVSYAALDAASARVAGLLAARGLKPGDRVGLMLPNVPQFAGIYYGILRAGGVVVPMNVLLKSGEVDFYLSDSGATELFVWHGFASEAPGTAIVVTPGEFEQLLAATEPSDAVVDRDDSDTAIILYTSGTTGTPKGAELTHANLRSNIQVVVDMLGVDEGDVILGALPLFHAFGQTAGLNTAIAAGACLTLIPRFDPAMALEMVARDGVTVFEGVPTMFSAMLHTESDADTSSLRLCVSGGAAMPVEVMRTFEERFDCKVLEGYGLSETSPVASFNHPDRERKPGSIGAPVAGVEMKLDGDAPAEILIRGHNVMKGYWNRADATKEAIDADGWFHSGDIGTVDDDGYFFIVDRKKDLIIRGGYNVYPREIEEVLYTHPAVREAAVVAVKHPELGEEIGAAVALKDGASATVDEIRDFVKAEVAAYKYPRVVWMVDELPKGPTGKILKREIVVPD